MMKLLNNLNFYGRDIKIQINNQEQINSICGKFLSCLTILITFLFLWFIGNDIIFKNRPISYTNQILTTNFPKVPVNNHDFPIAVGLGDIVGLPFYNELYIDMKLLKKSFTIDEKTGKTISSVEEEVKLETCSYEHFPQITKEDFDSALLSTFFCPTLDFNFSLEGYWSTSYLSYLSLVVSKCNNETLSKNKFKNKTKKEEYCISSDEIDAFISYNSINVKISTLNTILTLSNFDKPFSPYASLVYKFLHSKNTKITNFLVQTQKLFTDVGFFFEENFGQYFLKLVELQTDTQEIDKAKNQFMRLNIYSSNISDHYYRKYVKIYDILANLGGFMKLLMMLFGWINRPFASIDKIGIFLENINKENEIDITCHNFKHLKLHKNSKFRNAINKDNNKNLFQKEHACSNHPKEFLAQMNVINQSSPLNDDIQLEILKNNMMNYNYFTNNKGSKRNHFDNKIKQSRIIDEDINKSPNADKIKKTNRQAKNETMYMLNINPSIDKSEIHHIKIDKLDHKLHKKDKNHILEKENLARFKYLKTFINNKSNKNLLYKGEDFNLNISKNDYDNISNFPILSNKWQSQSLKFFLEAYYYRFKYSYFDLVKFTLLKFFCRINKKALKKNKIYSHLHENLNKYIDFINIVKNMAHIDSINEISTKNNDKGK